MSRSMVTMMQFNEQKQDYVSSLENLEENTEQYNETLQECHCRGADRCAKVANMHRGLYVKAAQFIASIRGGTGDRGVPKPYIDALSVFTDQAPHKSIKEVAEPLKECMMLGKWPEEPLNEACDLQSIEEKPIASASLAQVHRAVLRDGSKAAVKIQYPELRKEMASDFAVFKTMGAQIKQMSAGYDLMWVVEDFEKNLTRELDFGLEAQSGEDTARQLSHLAPRVYVPKVFKQLSSPRVLVMEYIDGLIKANDPVALRAAGLDVQECAQLICDTFAEMIFVHGRVHADPHAGNIYFRAVQSGGKLHPQLVLLDHGLYYDLSEADVRLNFCRYWQACCAKDSKIMQELGQRFAGSLHRFLPLILSPWFIFGGSGVSLHEILSAAQGHLPDTIKLKDVADFVVATRSGGANLLGVLHSLGYTRGMLEALEFPEGKRIASMLQYALIGDTPTPLTVPRELSVSERRWVQWRVSLLSGHIRLMAPLARPLIRFAKAENAPPLWLVSAVVVGATATTTAILMTLFKRRSLQL
eukprot:TRINITY_DN78111_c0_g1_i1.p1 TRINITY_DN78111_c0_g1~~TRINITY_DN78111_c0_g1_i1.p1  ORF type:complete len:586 (-),score=118.33 TRINITY_DN78111_c0_g1_i1:22-1605(-)